MDFDNPSKLSSFHELRPILGSKAIFRRWGGGGCCYILCDKCDEVKVRSLKIGQMMHINTISGQEYDSVSYAIRLTFKQV